MTMQIEIYEATLTKNICTVAYCLQDEQGTADVPMYQISTDKLTDYIEKNEINLVEFINPKLVSLECDGMDGYYMDPF